MVRILHSTETIDQRDPNVPTAATAASTADQAGRDIEAAADALTAAFEHYPFTRHVIAADDHLRRLREFQRIFLADIGVPYGRVWVDDDVRSAAVWTTPRTREAGDVFAPLLPRLTELAGDRAHAYAAAEAAMAPHRPSSPAWFLGTIGVHPDAQGRGLGRRLLTAALDEIDAERADAFLETSSRPNVAFYESFGFEVTAAYEIPDHGPLTWAMSRPSRRA